MTELQLAKRVIQELQIKFIEMKAENEYLKKNIDEDELDKYLKMGSKPQKFNDKELSQMIHTLVKLTDNHELSPDDIAVMINTNLTDVYRVYNNIDNYLNR